MIDWWIDAVQQQLQNKCGKVASKKVTSTTEREKCAEGRAERDREGVGGRAAGDAGDGRRRQAAAAGTARQRDGGAELPGRRPGRRVVVQSQHADLVVGVLVQVSDLVVARRPVQQPRVLHHLQSKPYDSLTTVLR